LKLNSQVQIKGRPVRRFVRCIILLQEKDGVVAQRAETVHQGVVLNAELWVRTERTGQTAVDVQIGGHDDGDETDEKDVPVLRRPEFLFHHQTKPEANERVNCAFVDPTQVLIFSAVVQPGRHSQKSANSRIGINFFLVRSHCIGSVDTRRKDGQQRHWIYFFLKLKSEKSAFQINSFLQ
jgi:hypothetical protein